MRAATFHGLEDVRVETVPDPRLVAEEDVIVAIELAGVCGSDLHVYHGRETGLDVGTVLGHEFVGRVVEVGDRVETLRVGHRVVAPFTTSCGRCFYCRRGLTARCEVGQLFGWVEEGKGLHGGQAELVRVPLADGTLVQLRDSDPAEVALLCGDVLATGLFCAELGGVAADSATVVLGCGPVGLMSVLAARELGAGPLMAVDAVAGRLALAEALGASALPLDENVVEAVRAATSGRGADIVLEAVGSPEATRLAIDVLRPGGTIAAVGVHTEAQFAFSPLEAYDRNLTYRAGRCPARAYLERALELTRRGDDPFGAIVSHEMELERAAEAYALFARRGASKIVLRPGGTGRADQPSAAPTS